MFTNLIAKVAEVLFAKLGEYLYDLVVSYLEDKKTIKKVLATKDIEDRQQAARELDDAF